jgi:hypothetical protein
MTLEKVIRETDGTRWIATPSTDVELYHAPRNPPNTGTAYTSGIDLHVHRTRTHGLRYYLYHWSMWQGTEDHIEPISHDQAQQFIEDMTGDYFGFPDSDDKKLLTEYGIDLSETA